MKKFATILMIASTALLAGCWTTQNGEKVGMITKLAKEGPFCPTWEASIVRGGFNAGSGVAGQAFEFTIESDEVAARLNTAMTQQKEVKIKYHKEFATLCRSDSGNYFLDSFEVIDNSKAPAVVLEETKPDTAKSDEIIKLLVEQNRILTTLLDRTAK